MKGENAPFTLEGYEEQHLVSYHSPSVHSPERCRSLCVFSTRAYVCTCARQSVSMSHNNSSLHAQVDLFSPGRCCARSCVCVCTWVCACQQPISMHWIHPVSVKASVPYASESVSGRKTETESPLWACVRIPYICVCINTHTHTHIYIWMYSCVSILSEGIFSVILY